MERFSLDIRHSDQPNNYVYVLMEDADGNLVRYADAQAALDDIKAAAWDEKVKARKTLDEVLKEAVWAMEWLSVFIAEAYALRLKTGIGNPPVKNALAHDEKFTRAQAFLDTYRTRQEVQDVD